jgi:hypothetical protein
MNYLHTTPMIKRAYLYQWYEARQPLGAPSTLLPYISDTSLTDAHNVDHDLRRCDVRPVYWTFKSEVRPTTADPEPNEPRTWPCS